MKRKYVKPGMQVVKLQPRNHLLVESTVKVFSTRYNGNEMYDL